MKTFFSVIFLTLLIINLQGCSSILSATTADPIEDEKDERTSGSALDDEIIETKASKIKYRYYDGKLYLYGKFQQEPYEILEINSASGRRIYLYHLTNFYEISSSDKPVELKAIDNSKLIQELEILRKTK